MRRSLVLFACILMLLPAAAAGAQSLASIPADDQEEIRQAIVQQSIAFQRDDGDAAGTFASREIRANFASPGDFMDMVRRTYPAVYRPRSLSFGELRFERGLLFQFVDIVGPDRKNYRAAYHMTRTPEGMWLINGCAVLPQP